MLPPCGRGYGHDSARCGTWVKGVQLQKVLLALGLVVSLLSFPRGGLRHVQSWLCSSQVLNHVPCSYVVLTVGANVKLRLLPCATLAMWQSHLRFGPGAMPQRLPPRCAVLPWRCTSRHVEKKVPGNSKAIPRSSKAEMNSWSLQATRIVNAGLANWV